MLVIIWKIGVSSFEYLVEVNINHGRYSVKVNLYKKIIENNIAPRAKGANLQST